MKPRILYIAFARSSFIRSDVEILSHHFRVAFNVYPWKRKWLVPWFLLRQLLFLAIRLPGARAVVVSSGGYWSVIPAIAGRLFSVPVYIILNGSDCASWPALGYGSLRKPLLKAACSLSYRYATQLLPVSDSLVSTENTYFSEKETIRQGYSHFLPEVKTGFRVIFNGLDADYWDIPDESRKENSSFIAVFSASQFILKGGDLIVEMARRLPDCTFFIAGLGKPPDVPAVPPNLHFLGRLSPGELKSWYGRCRFHLQLSIFEGFGCTLAEAMLCRCIPIGTNVNMIPGIIGETGFILHKRDPDLLESLIRNALSHPDPVRLGRMARERIATLFSLQRREEALCSLILGQDGPGPVKQNH